MANKYNISDSTLENWINKYNSEGFDNLTNKLNNNKYTSEFKLSVIQYRQVNNTSYRETAEHFDITNGSIICNWEKAYQQRGLSGL
ncbi:helix-turn-helix domain-containing protein [Anaerococcus cruorum]|uniref:helix-turn-helix domain-containing protein n=1 Tax=Anaerococcus sp. WGS1529 TaxID=3366812 RepID=UPI00372D105C